MPRYKYSCIKCELEDVKQVLYKGDRWDRGQEPLCGICGEALKREFMKPPQAWMNQQRRV